MTKTRAQNRFYNSWVDIVLTVVSIIQGLAFNDLIIRFPLIYDYTIANNDVKIFTSFILAFTILIRIFQTYITAALDYDDWSINFFDLFLIFIIGAVEYYAFSELTVGTFSIRKFHVRISIISIIGIIGYLGALLRLKEEIFPSYFSYRKEVRLQSVNIAGVAFVQLISIFIIFTPEGPEWILSFGGLLSAVILSFNIFFSIRQTFCSRCFESNVENIGENTQKTELLQKVEILTKIPGRENLLSLLDIFNENFGYVFEAIFETNEKLTKEILKDILKIDKGNGLLGYRSFYLAIDKLSGSCVGIFMFRKGKIKIGFKHYLNSLLALVIILKRLGVLGVIRTFKNLGLIMKSFISNYENEIYIDYIAVSNSSQGQGVGSQILDYIKSVSKNFGNSSISLDVRENNIQAQQFFIRQGFTVKSIFRSESDELFGKGGRIHMRLEL